MLLLTVKDLKKTFVERTLFENVSFDVDSNSRIGLIGPNGSGKTTLFKIIMGEESYDSGLVSKNGGAIIGAMSQHVENEDTPMMECMLRVFSRLINLEAELEEINSLIDLGNGDTERLVIRQQRITEEYERNGGLTYRSRARATALGLGFVEADFDRHVSSFSGGEKNKIQMARILLSDANLLLLDEPTNHLDIQSVEWLENYLTFCDKAFILISHDRYFLDKVTNRTIELTPKKAVSYTGGYSVYMEKRSTEREIQLRHYKNTCKEIRRIQGIVEQQRRWGQERNFVTAEAKLNQIERLKSTLVEPERNAATIRFGLTAGQVSGNDVLTCEDVHKSFDGNLVVNNVSFEVKKGERVFLIGANGCGKTTLLKMIAGILPPDSGILRIGANVMPGYYDQTLSNLSHNKTVLSEAWDDYYAELTHTQIRNILASFLFRTEDEVKKPVSLLSGGEKARLQLLKLMMSNANFLLLDEPTNHLDIDSRNALESALDDYEGTMLIVSHDRFLINNLADKIIYMSDEGTDVYYGGYDDFIAEREAREAMREQYVEESDPTESAAKLEYKTKKQRQSAINRKRGEVSRREKEYEQIEARIEELTHKLTLPEICTDYVKSSELSEELESIRERSNGVLAEWDEAQSELAKLIDDE